VSNANREADIQVASNAVQVAQADRDRDVKKAQFKAIAIQKGRKRSRRSGSPGRAGEELKVRQAERDAAEKEAQIEVQAKEAARREQELAATIVKPAEAQRAKLVIDAEAPSRSP